MQWNRSKNKHVLMKLLAIRLGYQKALHSHSAKSPKYGDISRWLTIAKSLVIAVFKFGLKNINRRSGPEVFRTARKIIVVINAYRESHIVRLISLRSAASGRVLS